MHPWKAIRDVNWGAYRRARVRSRTHPPTHTYRDTGYNRRKAQNGDTPPEDGGESIPGGKVSERAELRRYCRSAKDKLAATISMYINLPYLPTLDFLRFILTARSTIRALTPVYRTQRGRVETERTVTDAHFRQSERARRMSARRGDDETRDCLIGEEIGVGAMDYDDAPRSGAKRFEALNTMELPARMSRPSSDTERSRTSSHRRPTTKLQIARFSVKHLDVASVKKVRRFNNGAPVLLQSTLPGCFGEASPRREDSAYVDDHERVQISTLRS